MTLRIFLLLLLPAASGVAGAQVAYVSVDKTKVYDQTSASGVALKPPLTPCNFNCPFAFSARVGGPNVSTIPPPSVSGPIASGALGAFWHGGVLGFNASNNEWELGYPPAGEWNSPTQADLDAKFANGLYTITVSGQPYPMNLSGDAYPAPPVMTLFGAGMWTDGKFVFDPRSSLTINTSTPSFGALGGFYGLYYCRPAQNMCQNTGGGTLTIPANTFVDGEAPFVVATFSNLVDQVIGSPTSSASYNARTQLLLKAQIPQPFPMTVTSSITPTVSNATAQIQPRPEDVGSTASVFSFFVAPSTKVLNAAAEKGARRAVRAQGGEKATSVECVLAQLNGSGQLQAVSAANLQAYVTGVLSGQAQAVTLLNNVATANIAGTALYVGYGQSAVSMLTAGLNQRALSIPGDVFCDPKAPKTGWWWNPAEGGRGYSIEVAGRNIFFASYLYDPSGRATWYVASGRHSLDGSLFTGSLDGYSRGQALGSAYQVPTPAVSAGSITLAFADATHGTMVWPGGSVAIERFNIVPNGTTLNPMDNQPESGWWWNPEESGRGFFLEWQGGQLFMAGYMYDGSGDPLWYLSTNTTPSTDLRSYSGTWWRYGDGQTLAGPYKPARIVDDNVAPVTITFQGAETAIMTLPGGRTTNIRRFRF
jgi:hypothetical protein